MRMSKSLLFLLVQELIWWLITALITVAVLFPLMSSVNYLHIFDNALIIVVAITAFRYSVFFNKLPFFKSNAVKFIVFTIDISLWVYILNRYEGFLGMHDIYMLSELGTPIHALNGVQERELFRYFYLEINIASLTALILIIILNLRFIQDYWKVARVRFGDMMQN
jgi:hypothetical protein